MSSEKIARSAVLSVVRSLSFEDRDDFVRSHSYDKKGSRYLRLDTTELTRERAISAYYPQYSVDNLYEYCVFRNLITLLNKYARLTGRRSFTLGHWTPVKQGGHHTASNWVIQTYADNQSQGEDMPSSDYKWTLKEQTDYIMSKINFNFVDDKFLRDMKKYIIMLGKVYYGQEEKEVSTSSIPSEFCA